MLTSKDQLLQEAQRGLIFHGYCEGTLTFKPTYKYNIGSSNYDTSYKVRVPSWTDRILFKIEDPDEISASLHCYESVDDIYSSDHKPVSSAVFIHPSLLVVDLFEGHYHGHYAEDRQFYAPSGSGDARREHENEEIDRAIALSLLEESRKGRRVKDDKSQLEDDEQLARAIQESLNFEPPPQYENVNTYQPMPVHFPTGY
ncbi:hypothetical protein Golob_010723, partial [Gossypium lobatum]|nr:hypothetical protein [Gossypium lobatum]